MKKKTNLRGSSSVFLTEPIHVSMMSAGCDDPPADRCGDSSIMIDGIEVSPKVSQKQTKKIMGGGG